ncbi:hypothetical protein KCU65_g10167, partial [Aureobasidium melanogenum]
MSSRPQPPVHVEQPDELSAHVEAHAEEWLLYFRNLNSYLSQVESAYEDNLALLDTAQQTVKRHEGVIAYQRDMITEKDTQIVRIQIEKERALEAAQPAVLPTRPAAAPAAEILSDPAEREASPLATPPSESSRPSEKLPDPEAFKGQRSDLRRFVQQICGKMTANSDRFPTAQSRLIYVAGRLKDDAYNLILPKIQYGVPQFVDYQQLLDYLDQAFGDPDRVQNAQNRLYNWKQKNQDFSVYYSEFQRLALDGEVPEAGLTPLLLQGISSELQEMLLHNPVPAPRDFRTTVRHLQELDNRYRQHQQQIRRTTTANRNAPRNATPARTPVVTTTAKITVPAATDPDAMDVSSARRPQPGYQPYGRRERGECYRCGSPNHRVADCPHPPPPGRPAPVNRPAQVRENRFQELDDNERPPSPTLTERSAKGGASI